MNKQWTEQDLDSLIASVEETLAKAESSQPLKKDNDQDQDDSQQAPEGQSAQPETQASPDAQQAPEGQPKPQEQAPEGQPEEQQLEGEENQPLSDEELQQIYGQMSPEELERHFSVIRQALQSHYGEQPGQEQSNQPEQEAQPESSEPSMEKSEKISALEKKIAEQDAAIEQITKAFEILAKPSRKSVTDLQFMSKGEEMPKPLTKSDLKEQASKLSPNSLSKSERDQLTRFFLYGEGQQEIEKIISRGGK